MSLKAQASYIGRLTREVAADAHDVANATTDMERIKHATNLAKRRVALGAEIEKMVGMVRRGVRL